MKNYVSRNPIAQLLCNILNHLVEFLHCSSCFLVTHILFPEMQCLAKHGHFLPGNMQGLTEDQIEELKYKDEYEKICVPQGGSVECEDPIGRRTGKGICSLFVAITKTVY